MPTQWQDWVHVIIGTHSSWLPGDPRGFRDHGHRIHSSGDYRNPPPPGEHAGLNHHAKQIAAPMITIPADLRPIIAEALGRKLERMKTPARIIAVGARHTHALARTGPQDAKPLIGRAKQFASHQVRARLPGSIWSESCEVVRVRDEDHYRSIVKYIADHADDGAAIWIHPDLRQASGPASIQVSGPPSTVDPKHKQTPTDA